jgi:hypothetical protein
MSGLDTLYVHQFTNSPKPAQFYRCRDAVATLSDAGCPALTVRFWEKLRIAAGFSHLPVVSGLSVES